MRYHCARSIAGVGLFIVASMAWAQKPAFEVASVKVNTSQGTGGSLGPRGDRFRAQNYSLKGLLTYAYGPENRSLWNEQVIGAPGWTETVRYDIDAKPPGDGPIRTGPELKAMVQSLLEERFHLKAHREMRDLPVYHLVVTRKGPKLSEDQTPPDPKQIRLYFGSASPDVPLTRGSMRLVNGPTTTLTGNAVPIPFLVEMLQGQSGRMIIDKTALSGLIDVKLQYAQNVTALPDGTPAEAGQTLFSALQEAGLKLESVKAPTEVLVIDSVERLSEN